MNLIKWFISQVGQGLYEYNEEKKRLLFLEKIKQANPTCQLFDSCKIIESHLGCYVIVRHSAKIKKSTIGNHVVLHPNVKVNRTKIGSHSYIAPKSIISYAEIGNYCSVGQDITIGLPRHPTKNFVTTYPAFFSKNNLGCCESFVTNDCYDEFAQDTLIGNDVWIGNNVLIPGGISIGNGAIIAAGSVVVKDVPSYAIIGGNPARLIRYRFSQKKIVFLLQIEWWNWPDEVIRDFINKFVNIKVFRETVEYSVAIRSRQEWLSII